MNDNDNDIEEEIDEIFNDSVIERTRVREGESKTKMREEESDDGQKGLKINLIKDKIQKQMKGNLIEGLSKENEIQVKFYEINNY